MVPGTQGETDTDALETGRFSVCTGGTYLGKELAICEMHCVRRKNSPGNH